jgi:hypothetical protein
VDIGQRYSRKMLKRTEAGRESGRGFMKKSKSESGWRRWVGCKVEDSKTAGYVWIEFAG